MNNKRKRKEKKEAKYRWCTLYKRINIEYLNVLKPP
jgi:hypothetical protein